MKSRGVPVYWVGLPPVRGTRSTSEMLYLNDLFRARAEKAGIVHAGVGKASFSADKLVANIRAFADAVQKAKPAGAKGTFIKKVSISSTMGPGVKLDPATAINQ